MLLGLLAFFIAAPDADRVTSLPGAPPLPSVQFSGFLDGAGGTKLHYWFVTCSADDDWASRPVVLWFNGGPGSSSVLGMLQEQGPLLMARQGGLHVNPWAWSTVANFLVFESPAGVGYSYCDATRHHKPCVNTDNSTADAAHSALLDFFGDAKFPELRNNAFYITGESYAGVYVPMLARRVLDANDAGVTPRVNLRSIAVGDPCTDNDSQLDAMDTLWYSQVRAGGRGRFRPALEQVRHALPFADRAGRLHRRREAAQLQPSPSSATDDDDDDSDDGTDGDGTGDNHDDDDDAAAGAAACVVVGRAGGDGGGGGGLPPSARLASIGGTAANCRCRWRCGVGGSVGGNASVGCASADGGGGGGGKGGGEGGGDGARGRDGKGGQRGDVG